MLYLLTDQGGMDTPTCILILGTIQLAFCARNLTKSFPDNRTVCIVYLLQLRTNMLIATLCFSLLVFSEIKNIQKQNF